MDSFNAKPFWQKSLVVIIILLIWFKLWSLYLDTITDKMQKAYTFQFEFVLTSLLIGLILVVFRRKKVE